MIQSPIPVQGQQVINNEKNTQPNSPLSRLLHYWWLGRVTLVVAFGFLPQNFRRWWGPMNDGFTQNEFSFSGGDNHRWRAHSNPS